MRVRLCVGASQAGARRFGVDVQSYRVHGAAQSSEAMRESLWCSQMSRFL